VSARRTGGAGAMERAGQSFVDIDDQAYGRAVEMLHNGGPRLPEPAVRDLAEEVIARLQAHVVAEAEGWPPPSQAEIDELCAALLDLDQDRATDLIRRATRAGMPADRVCLGLIAGAARELGARWARDDVSLAQMSLGIARSYGLLRGLRTVFPPVLAGTPDQVRVCFATVPGETHTMGVTMAADVFRRRGWEIDVRIGEDHERLVAGIAEGGYGVIGLSAGTAGMLMPLLRLKVALRVSNPRAWIMVCGKICELVPDLSHKVDADLVATDVDSAIDEMERLVEAADYVVQGAAQR